MTTFGVTPTGFVLKRLADILADMQSALSQVNDPVTGEYLTPNLADENDPLVQVVNATADQLSVCWEQLQMCYSNFDPLAATGAGLSSLVQLNAMLRRTLETDTQLRIRQQAETALPSYRQVDAIYSAIVDVVGVQFARVYQNATLVTDARGIPAKSVCAVVVVLNGAPYEQNVAEAIFQKTPIGVGFYGNNTLTCTDSLGTPYDVSYELPSSIPITIVVNIQVLDDSDWPTDGIEQIKAALVAYAEYGLSPNIGFPPGVDVINSRLYTPVNSVAGHKIVSILLARDSNPPAEVDITIDWNETAEIITDNISVVSA